MESLSTKPGIPVLRIAGTDHALPCATGDTVLRVGLRAGLGFSYECNAGSCGACKVELISGRLRDLYPEAPGIADRDRQRKRWLACQSVPVTDCTVRARLQDAYRPRHLPVRQQAVLERTRNITHDIREFTFRTPGEAKFIPGQYSMLLVQGAQSPRAYSMSSTSNDDRIWQFMIRRVGKGIVSNALFELQAGESIEIDGPYGLAYLRQESEGVVVCIAGGSGIAPMISILSAVGAQQGRRRATWLFYGGRGPSDVPSHELISEMTRLGEELNWHPSVSDPALSNQENWSGEVGFVHETVLAKLPKPLDTHEFYLAGPPLMIEAVVRLLVTEHKVSRSQIHFDRFF